MNVIIKAAQFAHECHEGQVRKFTNRPYIEHPMRVAGRLSLIPGATEEAVAAAWLHDVIEDCNITHADLIRESFGHIVADLVQELTNPSKQHPELRRKARKAMDREHLSKASRWAKIIKLIDRIDNIRDMAGAEEDFKRLYRRESELLAEALESDDQVISSLIFELRMELAS